MATSKFFVTLVAVIVLMICSETSANRELAETNTVDTDGYGKKGQGQYGWHGYGGSYGNKGHHGSGGSYGNKGHQGHGYGYGYGGSYGNKGHGYEGSYGNKGYGHGKNN